MCDYLKASAGSGVTSRVQRSGGGLSAIGARQNVHGGVDAARRDGDAGKPQPHLDSAECADERQVVEIAKMTDAEDSGLERPEAIAEAHVEAREDEAAQRVGAVAFREAHGGQGIRIVGWLGALQLQGAGLTPDGGGGACRRAVPGVAREDIRQSLLSVASPTARMYDERLALLGGVVGAAADAVTLELGGATTCRTAPAAERR